MIGDLSGNLRQRFMELWRRCLLEGAEDGGEAVFNDLVHRYREPHRRYHGWAHLTHCLAQLDAAAPAMQSPDAVELALWFHDAVYRPRAHDNEWASSLLFQQAANGLQWADFVSRVSEYILLTRHQEAPSDTDGCFVVDIDLSPFAVRWEDYLRDSENVRWEAPDVADEVFFPAQLAFLRSLLGRPRIYRTDWFHSRLEASARSNITTFIDRLEAAGYSHRDRAAPRPGD